MNEYIDQKVTNETQAPVEEFIANPKEYPREEDYEEVVSPFPQRRTAIRQEDLIEADSLLQEIKSGESHIGLEPGVEMAGEIIKDGSDEQRYTAKAEQFTTKAAFMEELDGFITKNIYIPGFLSVFPRETQIELQESAKEIAHEMIESSGIDMDSLDNVQVQSLISGLGSLYEFKDHYMVQSDAIKYSKDKSVAAAELKDKFLNQFKQELATALEHTINKSDYKSPSQDYFQTQYNGKSSTTIAIENKTADERSRALKHARVKDTTLGGRARRLLGRPSHESQVE